jgi:hypothetical protein
MSFVQIYYLMVFFIIAGSIKQSHIKKDIILRIHMRYISNLIYSYQIHILW